MPPALKYRRETACMAGMRRDIALMFDAIVLMDVAQMEETKLIFWVIYKFSLMKLALLLYIHSLMSCFVTAVILQIWMYHGKSRVGWSNELIRFPTKIHFFLPNFKVARGKVMHH